MNYITLAKSSGFKGVKIWISHGGKKSSPSGGKKSSPLIHQISIYMSGLGEILLEYQNFICILCFCRPVIHKLGFIKIYCINIEMRYYQKGREKDTLGLPNQI